MPKWSNLSKVTKNRGWSNLSKVTKNRVQNTIYSLSGQNLLKFLRNVMEAGKKHNNDHED